MEDDFMKKLLALILVLSLATVANAVLVGNTTGDDTEGSGSQTLNITGGGYDTYVAIAIVGTGTIAGTVGADAPASSGLAGTLEDLGLGSLGTGEVWTMADMDSPYVYNNGVWLTIGYTGAVNGDVITAYDVGPSGTELNVLGSITIVPEPMTLALLGLGGLFIRRK